MEFTRVRDFTARRGNTDLPLVLHTLETSHYQQKNNVPRAVMALVSSSVQHNLRRLLEDGYRLVLVNISR